MGNESFRELREESLLDAAIIEQLDLTPEQFITVSTTLQALNWIKHVVCEEGINLTDLDRKFVIKRLINIELSRSHVEQAKQLLARKHLEKSGAYVSQA